MPHAFSTCVYSYICVFKVIMLAWGNQSNFFENATAYRKRILKTHAATSHKCLETSKGENELLLDTCRGRSGFERRFCDRSRSSDPSIRTSSLRRRKIRRAWPLPRNSNTYNYKGLKVGWVIRVENFKVDKHFGY